MDSPVTYIPGFIDSSEATEWFDTLWNNTTWVQRDNTPRREYWTNDFNRPYTYGRGVGIRTYEDQPRLHEVNVAKHMLFECGHGYFEGCFLNGYKDGYDSLGWHSDDDPGIDHARGIAVITLGQQRIIKIREIFKQPSETEKGEFGPATDIMLENGSLLMMHPGMQQSHQHRIPKAGFIANPRISLTFRGLLK